MNKALAEFKSFFGLLYRRALHTDERFRDPRTGLLVVARGQQDEAKAASGQDAYRRTRAIINVPFTSAESERGKKRSESSPSAELRMRFAYQRASPFVLHAPAETNLPDKSWSYDRGAGKEMPRRRRRGTAPDGRRATRFGSISR